MNWWYYQDVSRQFNFQRKQKKGIKYMVYYENAIFLNSLTSKAQNNKSQGMNIFIVKHNIILRLQ